MTPDQLVDQLAADGPLLADAAAAAGWDAPVPATDWTVRDLVTHVGGVHRWAAGIVRDRASSPATPEGDAVGTGPPDDELLDWFRAGHAALVETLRSAPDDLECFTFLPAPSSRAFWTRRQTHETAIHRVDAEAAAGRVVTEFRAEFAQDGIAEVLLGFAARPRRQPIEPGVIGLAAADGPAWRVELRSDVVVATPDEATDADAVVSGTSSNLYR